MKARRSNKRYLGDRPESSAPCCEHPGCTRPGVYRAPRDRTLRSYIWLCLEHVQDYNQTWDFYAGLSQAEIEAEIRRDTVWQRPTWRLGAKTAAPHDFRDPFRVFEEAEENGKPGSRKPKAAPGSLEQAMEILGLEHPLTRQALKMRYHELAKEHHPDHHGGDKAAEERLKIINQAYAALARHLDGDVQKRAI